MRAHIFGSTTFASQELDNWYIQVSSEMSSNFLYCAGVSHWALTAGAQQLVLRELELETMLIDIVTIHLVQDCVIL
jgi:hypothetical protein